MIGFITTTEVRDQIAAAITAAQDARGWPHYIALSSRRIYAGEHAGMEFIPMSDADTQQIMRNNLRLCDFPEFPQLVALLGGMDARVDLDVATLDDPSQQEG